MDCQKRTPLTSGNSIIERTVLEQRYLKHHNTLLNVKAVIGTPLNVSVLYIIDLTPTKQRSNARTHRKDYAYQKRMIFMHTYTEILGIHAWTVKEDMKMIRAISQTMNRARSITTQKGPVSLNENRRREDLRNIIAGNKRILGRIEGARSQYSVKSMAADYHQHQRYCINSSFSLRKMCETRIRKKSNERTIPTPVPELDIKIFT